MEKRFVERAVYGAEGLYVKTPCEVIAEGQNWIVTKRPEFYDGKQEADKYYVEYNGKRACGVFNNAIEAILNAIGRVYGDEHRGKNVSQFHAFAYAMLEGMPSYE
jgi:hypothetical protein